MAHKYSARSSIPDGNGKKYTLDFTWNHLPESSYLSRYIYISVVLEVLLLKNIFSDYKLPEHGELLSYMGILFAPQTGTKPNTNTKQAQT